MRRSSQQTMPKLLIANKIACKLVLKIQAITVYHNNLKANTEGNGQILFSLNGIFTTFSTRFQTGFRNVSGDKLAILIIDNMIRHS